MKAEANIGEAIMAFRENQVCRFFNGHFHILFDESPTLALVIKKNGKYKYNFLNKIFNRYDYIALVGNKKYHLYYCNQISCFIILDKKRYYMGFFEKLRNEMIRFG